RDAPIPVTVNAHVEPDLRHPLRVSHGAGPGADHVFFVRPTAFDDEESIEELSFPIGASARLAPSQCRQRRNDGTHVLAAGAPAPTAHPPPPPPKGGGGAPPCGLSTLPTRGAGPPPRVSPLLPRKGEARGLFYSHWGSRNPGGERSSPRPWVSALTPPTPRR